jgi:tetratricopeptide (TPR) repeat protein
MNQHPQAPAWSPRRLGSAKANLLSLMLATAYASPLSGQVPDHQTAAEALAGCVAANAGDEAASNPQARALADHAQEVHEALLAANPDDVDVLVGLAQVLSRCQVPRAGVARVLGILDRSNSLLVRAIQLRPDHWLARYVLAMNHYTPPPALGRTDDAIREFEALLALQGTRNDVPEMAAPFAYLGDLYVRKGRRREAVDLWRKGAALFPGDTRLAERLAGEDERPARAASLPDVVALEPLAVEARDHQLDDARSGTALRRLDVLMSPGGAADLLQALQTLPGATRAGDGAELYVRGGDAGETAIFLDGGRVMSAGRWETLNGSVMGVMDANVLRSAYFSAGGFSARYGNALSGVVDAATEDAPQRPGHRVGISLVQAAATSRLTVSRSVGAWASASLTDVGLLSRLSGQEDFSRAPRSIQGTAGVAVQPIDGLTVKGSALVAGDRAARLVDIGGFRGPFSSEGGMAHLSVTGRWLSPSARDGLGVAVVHSTFTSRTDFGVLRQEREYGSSLLRLDGDHIAGDVRLRAGLEGTLITTTSRGTVPTTDRLAPGSPERTLAEDEGRLDHLGGYVEVETAPVRDASLVVGLRADRLPGEDATTVDPRVALGYRRNDWVFRVATGAFHQGRWRPRYEVPNAGTPTGTPRVARHVVVAGERDGEPSVRLEAYAKAYGSYEGFGEGPKIQGGNARGVDAIIRWSRQERLNGWVTYSILDADVRLAEGSAVPAAVDVTHSLTAVGRLTLGENWELGMTAKAATGRPYTEVLGVRRESDGTVPLYGAINGARLPQYTRFDMRLTRFARLPSGLAVGYLEVINVLNQANVASYTWGQDYTVRSPIRSYFAVRSAVLGLEIQFQGRS